MSAAADTTKDAEMTAVAVQPEGHSDAPAFGTSVGSNVVVGGQSVPAPYNERLYAELETAEKQRASTPQGNEPFAEKAASDVSQPPLVKTESVVSASFASIPVHLHSIMREIRKLGEGDLLAINDLTQRRAVGEVYSLLQYTGSAWYLPNIRPIEEGEKAWELNYEWEKGVILTLGGRRMEFSPLSYLQRIGMLFMLWFTLWLILPHWLVEPGKKGYVFDPIVTVVFSAIVGGVICRLLQIPPLIGVMWIAIMWNNIPTVGHLTSGIRPEVRTIASRMGLTVILLRAGFSLSLASLQSMWKNSLALAYLPCAIETMVHSLIAHSIFNYTNYTWSFCQGMICSIVAPAVIVPGVLMLQSQGYGTGKGGPLNYILSAVGIDIASGVWAGNFILGLLFDSGKSLGLAIALGPIQIVVGAIIGIVVGIIFFFIIEIFKNEAQRLPNGKYSEEHMDSLHIKTFIVFVAFGFIMIFLGYKLSLAGGGSCCTMLFGVTVAHLWIKDGDAVRMEQKKRLGMSLSSFWDLLIMPYLFSMVGSNINVKKIFNSDFFPKALLIWAVTNVVRFIVSFLCSTGMDMPLKHRILYSCAYLGKAAGQAALGGIAASNVAALVAGAAGDAEKLKGLEGAIVMADNIKNMAGFYIMFSAPLAATLLTKIAPHVLEKKK